MFRATHSHPVLPTILRGRRPCPFYRRENGSAKGRLRWAYPADSLQGGPLPEDDPGSWGMQSYSGREIWPEEVEETPPSPHMPSSRPYCFHLPGDSQVWPMIPGGAGGGRRLTLRALARPRGDRKPGHRGLSLAAAALPQPGRKFCRALSAGASLAVLLNRKPGCAGAGRWRRERRTPKPRAPAGTSGGEASERTPRAPAPRGLPRPSPWKPRPRRWQGPNLHPSAGSARPAHGPTET